MVRALQKSHWTRYYARTSRSAVNYYPEMKVTKPMYRYVLKFKFIHVTLIYSSYFIFLLFDHEYVRNDMSPTRARRKTTFCSCPSRTEGRLYKCGLCSATIPSERAPERHRLGEKEPWWYTYMMLLKPKKKVRSKRLHHSPNIAS